MPEDRPAGTPGAEEAAPAREGGRREGRGPRHDQPRRAEPRDRRDAPPPPRAPQPTPPRPSRPSIHFEVLRRRDLSEAERPGMYEVDVCATFKQGDEPLRGVAEIQVSGTGGIEFPRGNDCSLDVEGKAVFTVIVPVSETWGIPVRIGLQHAPEINIKGMIGPPQSVNPKMEVRFEPARGRSVPLIKVFNKETHEPLVGVEVVIVDANAETIDRLRRVTNAAGEPDFPAIRLRRGERERDVLVSLTGYPDEIHREWITATDGDPDAQPMPRHDRTRPASEDVRMCWRAGCGDMVEAPLSEGAPLPPLRPFRRAVLMAIVYWVSSTLWRRRYVRWSGATVVVMVATLLLAHPANSLLGRFHSEMSPEEQQDIHEESVNIAARVVGGGAYNPAEDIARLAKERQETENPFRKAGMTTDLRRAWEEVGRREGFMKSDGRHVTFRVQRGPGNAQMDIEVGRGQAVVSADSASSDLRKAWEKLGQQEGWLRTQADSSSTHHSR